MADTKPILWFRMYEKESKHGNQYFVARLGGAKLTMWQSKTERGSDGKPVWHVNMEPVPVERQNNASPSRFKAVGGDKANAKKAYEAFLATWKDADADLPMLVAAKKEYAAL